VAGDGQHDRLTARRLNLLDHLSEARLKALPIRHRPGALLQRHRAQPPQLPPYRHPVPRRLGRKPVGDHPPRHPAHHTWGGPLMRRRRSWTTRGGNRPRRTTAATSAVCSAYLAAMLGKASTAARTPRHHTHPPPDPAAPTPSPATTPAASTAPAHSAICASMPCLLALARPSRPGQPDGRLAFKPVPPAVTHATTRKVIRSCLR